MILFFLALVVHLRHSCEYHRGKLNLRYSLDETDASEHRGQFIEAILKGKSIFCFFVISGLGQASAAGPGPAPAEYRRAHLQKMFI